MSLEENKAIIRRWIEACNKRNLAVLDELVSPDFFHFTWKLRGPEGMKQFYTDAFKSFPDLHETIEDIIAEEDKVWHRFTTTGTHNGEFRGLAPTGKKVTWTGVNFWRILEGKVIGKGSIYDMLDTLKQLGVIKYTEKAKAFLP
jgi:steroid delta-isomerase-like uncharacterized protein